MIFEGAKVRIELVSFKLVSCYRILEVVEGRCTKCKDNGWSPRLRSETGTQQLFPSCLRHDWDFRNSPEPEPIRLRSGESGAEGQGIPSLYCAVHDERSEWGSGGHSSTQNLITSPKKGRPEDSSPGRLH